MIRKAVLVVSVLFFGLAMAQAQIDIAIGAGTIHGSPSNSGNFSPVNLSGGTYLNLSGDYTFWHNLGFGGEVAWRAGQGSYAGVVPYRPIFYDFGGVYAPRFGRIGVELKAGIGAESLHFYTGTYTCSNFGCSNYQSSNHFMGAFGAGVKLYATQNVFIRPEVDLYMVHNNVEFSGPRAVRYGLSIGYTFGGQ